MHTRIWRLSFVLGLLLIAALSLFYRALVLQVVDQDFLRGQGEARAVRYEEISANRGEITDRNGVPLAVSTPVKTIWANPKEIKYATFPYTKVAKILGMRLHWVKRRLLGNARKSFVYVKRKVSPDIAREIDALNVKGLYSKTTYKRFYPAGEVAAHLVGFTGVDEKGQEGLELAYNKWLTGIPGEKKVLKDRKGGVVKDLALIRKAKPGHPLQLSIDMRLQYLAYKELKAAVLGHHATAGSLVLMDVKTREVLAMVNQPSYNPNNRRQLDINGLKNRAMVDTFEPGSTMKPFTIAAALESGKFNVNSKLDTSPGFFRVGRKAIRDHKDYGLIDLTTIIAKSSNVGASKIALTLTGPVVRNMFHRVGFGETTGTGFPGESSGKLQQHVKWRPIAVATMSYGYGLSVTALQLAQAYAILAGHGEKMPVSLLKLRQDPQAVQIMPRKVADEVVQMLHHVVLPGGTAHRARVKNYFVAGKTGTVHEVGKNGYEGGHYKAIFAGLAPLTSPRLVMVVIVDDPKGGEYYGGEVAAPVFSRVMADAMRLMNIQPDHFEEKRKEKSNNTKDLKQSVWAIKQKNNNNLSISGRG
jgi:cell division protein FtsI (penicillin-binding protein 3)